MHRRTRLSVRYISVVCALALAASLAACGEPQARTTSEGAVDATGTVQAQGSTSTASSDAPVAKGDWPEKVGAFAARASYPVWWPKSLPAGFKVDTVDTVEMEPGAGPVCDVLFVSGDKVINFTQGSPKSREYEFTSASKTAWGPEKAGVDVQDPADAAATTIVFSKDGNFAELRGDVSLAELKKIAASMEVVK